MKAVSSLSAAALALGLAAGTASAQVSGIPVNYAPAATGVTVHAEYGRGLNDESGKINSIGGGVTLGLPMFQVGAALSYFGLKDTEPQEISFGGHAAYKLPLPPTTPVTLSVVAGLGYTSFDAGGNTLLVPAGVTLGIKVPSTSVDVMPWVSPQFRLTRVSNGTSESESSFGASGGVSIGLPVGVGFDLMLDWNRIPENAFGSTAPSANQISFGIGAHYLIQVPSLSGGM